MMDSVGHYARPELLSLLLDRRAATPLAVAAAPQTDSSIDPPALDAQRLSRYLDGATVRAADGIEASYLNALASFNGRSA
jgi:aliphatic nitrilase